MTFAIHTGDCREVMRTLPERSVHTCISSPPYFGLRDYGVDGQIGLEDRPDCLGWATGNRCGECFVCVLVDVYREVWRVLRDDGTCWLNLGDSYAGSWGAEGRTTSHGNSAYNARQMQAKSITNHPKRSRRIPTKAEGLKPKDLIGVPWRVALALQADGWYLRQDIIWAKPNPMPESVRDRCTKSHEYLFLLSKGPRYYFDQEAIAEQLSPASVERLSQPGLADQAGSDRVPGKTNGNMKAVARSRRDGFIRDGKSESHVLPGQQAAVHRSDRGESTYDVGKRNKRSVWTVAMHPFKEAHFATFPPALVEPCILAGCPAGGVVLDPFGGAGTTAVVAERLGRDSLLIELNHDYADIARRRLADVQPGLSLGATA